jgi:hypothetical protein
MPNLRPPEHTIEIAGGRIQVHISCMQCSNTAWTYQHIAWLAESLAEQLAKVSTVASPALSMPLSSTSTSLPPSFPSSITPQDGDADVL